MVVTPELVTSELAKPFDSVYERPPSTKEQEAAVPESFNSTAAGRLLRYEFLFDRLSIMLI